MIAGDSWGLIAVPVIQEYPATAFIFAPWRWRQWEKRNDGFEGSLPRNYGGFVLILFFLCVYLLIYFFFDLAMNRGDVVVTLWAFKWAFDRI